MLEATKAEGVRGWERGQPGTQSQLSGIEQPKPGASDSQGLPASPVLLVCLSLHQMYISRERSHLTKGHGRNVAFGYHEKSVGYVKKSRRKFEL